MARPARNNKKGGKPLKKDSKRIQLFKRANVPGHVYIHNDERLFIAPLNNISAGGVFIDGVTTIPVGNQVRVVVKSPNLENAVQAKGTVIRVEKSTRRGLAVQFSGITTDARESIQSCVHSNEVDSAFKVLG